MIEILKQTKNEILVKQGNSIYSTTLETAPQEVLEKLQEKPQQETKKKTTTKKKTNTKKAKKEEE